VTWFVSLPGTDNSNTAEDERAKSISVGVNGTVPANAYTKFLGVLGSGDPVALPISGIWSVVYNTVDNTCDQVNNPNAKCKLPERTDADIEAYLDLYESQAYAP
jgi:hypothetical protein